MTDCDKAEFSVSAPLDEFSSVLQESFGNSSSGVKILMGALCLILASLLLNSRSQITLQWHIKRDQGGAYARGI